jgi:TPR repeat protein
MIGFASIRRVVPWRQFLLTSVFAGALLAGALLPGAARAREFPEQFSANTLNEFAKNGDAWAMFRLATKFSSGDGVERNERKARDWMERAADGGYQPAMVELGLTYLAEGAGENDRAAGVAWLNKAADLHFGPAMFNLGVLSIYEKNFDKAKSWFEKGKDEGHQGSVRMLAYLYGRGDGVKKDCAEAARLLKTAANAGDALAPDMFHFLFRNGRGGGGIKFEAPGIVGAAKAGGRSVLNLVGESSFCGTPGQGGKVVVDTKSISNWNVEIQTGGGNAGNNSAKNK